jgi:hypothetical protein
MRVLWSRGGGEVVGVWDVLKMGWCGVWRLVGDGMGMVDG